MKIISKYKDYYDYLQGIYGVDEKLVLDRREFCTTLSFSEGPAIKTFYIGEWMVQGLIIGRQIYFGDDIKQFTVKKEPQPSKWYRRYFSGNKTEDENWAIPSNYYRTNLRCLKKPKFLGDNSPTWKLDCPILLSVGLWEGANLKLDDSDFCSFPILTDYSIQKVFTPKEIWLLLSEWLSKRVTKNEPDVPIGDDMTRLKNAGFDTKTSFRH